MKAIVVLFDSLSRKFLPPYGNDWVKAPNFERLARNSVTFDKCFVGSMPCMPARRELHTGRHNFLHRSWGPLEPFDDSMPEILHRNKIYSHLISDHYHYWEDGGATYHNRYSSWEIIRGQEADKWKGEVADPDIPPHHGESYRQDWVNRKYMHKEEDTTQVQTFDRALEFLKTNKSEDNWFLQVECFDPHPPFFVPDKYRKLYPDNYDGPQFDWPFYDRIGKEETPEMIEHCQKLYAALVSMCDYSLGRIMDFMDANGMWKDTMLIVTTDHGFLLGEHGWWAFVKSPFYDEVSVKPLFIWDPRCGRKNQRCQELVQTHDLPATLLEYFNIPVPQDMQGKPLKSTIASNAPVRDACLFGVFGGHVNCSDGRYVYMKAPVAQTNRPLYNYTLMPTHMKHFFSVNELKTASLADSFSFTKGVKPLKIEAEAFMAKAHELGDLLFDLEIDPTQSSPINNKEVKEKMTASMIALMKENDAPAEQFTRLGLDLPHSD
jgi:arylsulfatase A-like enzyme